LERLPDSRSRLATKAARLATKAARLATKAGGEVTVQDRQAVTTIGGPAAGGRFAVEVVAGHLPLFLGLEGANYVLDRSALSGEVVTYLHWPVGAAEPERPPELPA
jgi:hypothetical protein